MSTHIIVWAIVIFMITDEINLNTFMYLFGLIILIESISFFKGIIGRRLTYFGVGFFIYFWFTYIYTLSSNDMEYFHTLFGTGIYVVLFLIATLPQLFKLKPFTYNYALKIMKDKNLEESKKFLHINNIISSLWGILFLIGGSLNIHLNTLDLTIYNNFTQILISLLDLLFVFIVGFIFTFMYIKMKKRERSERVN